MNFLYIACRNFLECSRLTYDIIYLESSCYTYEMSSKIFFKLHMLEYFLLKCDAVFTYGMYPR